MTFETRKGFTLVETIISLAIFMVVAVVAVGSLVRIVALNRQAQTLQSSVNNISFALDSMSREIREGSDLYCKASFNPFGGETFDPGNSGLISDCSGTSGNQLIAFRSSKADPTNSCALEYAYLFTYDDPAYSTDPSHPRLMLEKAQQTNCTDLIGSAQAPFTPIVSPDATLQDYDLGFFSQVTAPLFLYKWVFIRLSGYSGIREQDRNYFNIQTSVSQRIHD